MKKMVLVITLLVGAGAGYHYGYVLPKQEREAQKEAARQLEQQNLQSQAAIKLPLKEIMIRSMAHPDIVMLAYFNRVRAKETASGLSLTDIHRLPFAALDKIKVVLNTVNHLQDNIEEVYLAFYPVSQDDSLSPVMALMGDYDVERIQQHLLKQLEAENIKEYGVAFSVLYGIDEETCEKTRPTAFYIDKKFIIAGAPALVARSVKRLKHKKMKNYVNTEQWQAFNSGKIVSIWLREPPTSIRRFFLPPYNGFVKDSYLSFHTFSDSFISYTTDAGVDTGTLDLVLRGKNVNDVLAIEKVWRLALAEHNNPLSKAVPLLTNAVDKLQLAIEARTLNMSLSMNRFWFGRLRDVIEEVTQYTSDHFFVQTLRTSRERRHQLSKKRLAKNLDPNPVTFIRFLQEIDLNYYKPPQESTQRINIKRGPFGIAIDKITAEGNDLSLTISALSGDIPNLGTGIGKASLTLLEIRDMRGEPLHDAATCGSKRFISSADLKRDKITGEYSSKIKVHLKKGSTLADVSSITGEVNLHLPTRISKHPIFLPSKLPHTARVNDVELTVFFENKGVIEYSLEGNTERVLGFRAINRKQELLNKLNTEYKVSENTLFSQPVKITDTYEGAVHSYELIYAEAVKDLDYPFNLSPIVVKQKPAIIAASEPDVMRITSEQFQQAVDAFERINNAPLTGPFFIEPTELQNLESLKGIIRFIAPVSVPGLTDILSTSIHLNKLTLLDGTEVNLLQSEAIEHLITVTEQAKLLSGRLLLDPMPTRPGLYEGTFLFQTDINVDTKRVQSLHGKLTVQVPQSANKITILSNSIGEIIGDVNFRAKLISINQAGYTLHITEGQERLLRVVPYNEAGQMLVPFFTSATIVDEVLQLKFEAGNAVSLDLYVAKDMQSVEYPLVLNYDE